MTTIPSRKGFRETDFFVELASKQLYDKRPAGAGTAAAEACTEADMEPRDAGLWWCIHLSHGEKVAELDSAVEGAARRSCSEMQTPT